MKYIKLFEKSLEDFKLKDTRDIVNLRIDFRSHKEIEKINNIISSFFKSYEFVDEEGYINNFFRIHYKKHSIYIYKMKDDYYLLNIRPVIFYQCDQLSQLREILNIIKEKYKDV